MSQTPEDPARADVTGDIYQECVQELRRPYPDYVKIQALVTLSLAETLREVPRQVAELSRQIIGSPTGRPPSTCWPAPMPSRP
jgi:hypothetical protein